MPSDRMYRQHESFSGEKHWLPPNRAFLPPLIFAVGDSFVGPLKLFKPNAIRVIKIKGASARGLVNVKSTTGANQKIRQDLARLDFENEYARDYRDCYLLRAVLFVFGTVDTHVNLLYKLAYSPNMDVDQFLRETCEKYVDFIKAVKDEIIAKLKAEFVICSAFMPVVQPSHIYDR